MAHHLSLARGRVLEFTGVPHVMGVLNCTPDSFYAGSRVAGEREAARQATDMIEAGATILDIGGESTRPGSKPVDAAEERSRVVPVIEAIRNFSDIPISIDTQKASVASSAIDAGADIVNDVSALRADDAMLSLVAEREVGVVLMHMLGTPETMQHNPTYSDVVGEILHFLVTRANDVSAAGVSRDQIIIDPGIGFGKRLEDNLRLIHDLPAFFAPGFPVLVGASRKRLVGAVLSEARGTDVPVGDRLAGTLAVHVIAAMKGADIIRVHDVRETYDAVHMVAAVNGAGIREAKGES